MVLFSFSKVVKGISPFCCMQPLLCPYFQFFLKVDKFWPVVKPVSDIKTEIKEEPIEDILDDTLDDSEWDKAAEEEILAANEGRTIVNIRI